MMHSMFLHLPFAPTLLAHSSNHSGHASHRAGLSELLGNALIRGFGWRLGASVAESQVHLGVVVVLIIGALILAMWLIKRRSDA